MTNSYFVSKYTIVDGDTIWMLTNDTGVLCRFEFPTMKLLSYYVLPNSMISQYGYLSFVKIKEKVYVFPYKEKNMFVVDTVNNIINDMKIPYLEGEENQYGKFHITGHFNDKLIMVGGGVTGIFYYDNLGFRRECDYIDLLKKNGVNIERDCPIFSDCYVKHDNKLYIPLYKSNKMLQIDIESEGLVLYEIDNGIRLRTIDYVGNDIFFFTTIDDEKVMWSIKEGVLEKKKLSLLSKEEKCYMRALYEKGRCYYIAACERKVFVEKKEGVNELGFDYPLKGALEEGATQFETIFRLPGRIVFQARSDGSLFYIDTQEDVIKKLDFAITNTEINRLIDDSYNGRKLNGIMMEKDGFFLRNYIKMI